MHANAALVNKLFSALDERDHAKMADCYHPKARFRDIAFKLHGRDRIHDMWRMICRPTTDIKVDVQTVVADEHSGCAMLIDRYTFGASEDPPKEGRPVVNVIVSRFLFEDDLILRQDDDCDPKIWARQALGEGIAGFLAGRIRLMRSLVANAKLDRFVGPRGDEH